MLETTKGQLEISILQEQIKKPLLTKEQMRFWICKFRKLDMSESDDRERLIESFVNAIYVFDDKIVLTFNYKEGTVVINLKDLESSDLGTSSPPYCLNEKDAEASNPSNARVSGLSESNFRKPCF